MRARFRFMLLLISVIAAGACCSAQSLGEVARRERACKQAQSGPERRVLSNDDLNSATAKSNVSAEAAEEKPAKTDSKPAAVAKEEKQSAAELQGKIKAQKQKVRELQAKIQEREKQLAKRDTAGTVTIYQNVTGQQGDAGGAGVGLCDVSNAMHSNPYKEWCAEPAKLTAELAKSQAKLKEEQAALESLQEEARRQGYGSAFYDPE